MKNIFVVTSSFDKTVDYIIQQYSENAVFFRFNVDHFQEYCLEVGCAAGWEIKSSNWTISKYNIDSIYYRKPVIPELSSYEANYHSMIARDIISLINGIVDDFDGTVLSKPSNLRKTENKTFQLLYALNAGIKVPLSYIGNSTKRIMKWKNKKTIIKPLTTGKVVGTMDTELFQTNYFYELNEDVSLTPIYIQEYEEKQYEVRLTIVDNDAYTVRIDTDDKLDWRRDYSKHTYSLIECPKSIYIICRQLLYDFGLRFGAFDFIVNQNDEWIFLEVNPNGQWLWLERALGIPISRSVVKLLTGIGE